MVETAGDTLTLLPRSPVTGSPRRTVYKHTCVKVPLSHYKHRSVSTFVYFYYATTKANLLKSLIKINH
jgi:hypothetical protein